MESETARYFLELSYDGGQYVGWQVQPNGTAVQHELQQALSKIINQPTSCIGCGRTDAGVHAKQFYAHFDTSSSLPENFLFRLNHVLPKDIAIQNIHSVKTDEHARFDAIKRGYQYFIHFQKDPFVRSYSTYINPDFYNFDLMQEAAELLINYKEFEIFCKSGGEQNHYLCDVMHSSLTIYEYGLSYEVMANRFLRGMVRRIVGTLLLIGREQITLKELKFALDKNKMLSKNLSVEPQGLFLTLVQYPFISQ